MSDDDKPQQNYSYGLIFFAGLIAGGLAIQWGPELSRGRIAPSRAFAEDPPIRPKVSAPIPDPLGEREDPLLAIDLVIPPEDRPVDFVAKREEILLAMEIELDVLLKDLGPDHPKVRTLRDGIRLTQKWLERKKREAQSSVALIPRTPLTVHDEDAKQNRQAIQLAAHVLSATPEVKAELQKQLQELIEQQFVQRQERRQLEIDRMAKRLEHMKKVHARQQANQTDVLQRRMTELLDPNADLNWNADDEDSVIQR